MELRFPTDDQGMYRVILDDLYDGVYFVDRDRRITFWNKAAERITGFGRSEVLGSLCFEHILNHLDGEGRSLCQNGCPLAACMEDGQPREADVFLHHKKGHRLPVQVRVTPIRDAGGEVVGAAELFSDNSAKQSMRQRMEELEQMALFDPLTRMANRRYAEMTLRSRLEEMSRYGWAVGVLFVDIDDFKSVNDTHGHEAGDAVLEMVGRTLSSNSRPFDVCARWGGEEFLSVLQNVSHQNLYSIANRFRSLVEHSHCAWKEERIRVTVSIGATLARPNDSVRSILRRVDALMYESKKAGKNLLTVDFLGDGEGRYVRLPQEPVSSSALPSSPKPASPKGKTAEP